jgi:uncharacterized protein
MEGQVCAKSSFVEGQVDLRAALDELIADVHARPIPRLTPRLVQLPSIQGKADVVIGMRRSGKTFFLYQQIANLEREGIPRERILYLNFEDERLMPLHAEDLHLVPDAFYRRAPGAREQTCWFLFDEIQNVPGWERFIRRLLDTENVRIIVTGSSAKLLSKEIATSLRGRSLTTELLPFSFAEALAHGGIEAPLRWPAPAKARSMLENRFARYMITGGFPEVQTVADDVRPRILQEYLDVVLFRDIVERHAVTGTVALRQLVRRLVRSPACNISINRLYNDFRSQGVHVSKDSLHAYLSHLEDAYLAFTVGLHSESERRKAANPRKCYLIDHGLARATTITRSEDAGHHLENIVYIELRRRGLDVAYYLTESGHEVDFVVTDRGAPTELVQVCASLSDSVTRARELRAIEGAARETGVDNATIVTLHDQGTVNAAGVRVRIEPAWRWLLRPRAI